MTNEPMAPSSPEPSWAGGVREGTEPVGYIPATKADAGTSPVYVGGDADAGGRDTVSATVAGAVAAAEARFREHESDTYGQGSAIGDALTLPVVPEQMPGDKTI